MNITIQNGIIEIKHSQEFFRIKVCSDNGFSDDDIDQQWGFALFDLQNSYCTTYLFLDFFIRSGGQGCLRTLRSVRLRDRVIFDDVLVDAPWPKNFKNPVDLINYIHRVGLGRYHFDFFLGDQLPIIEISIDDLNEVMDSMG